MNTRSRCNGFAAVVALGLLVAATGCGSASQQPSSQGTSSEPKSGGVLRTGEVRELINRDQWRTGGVQDQTKIGSMYSGLIQFDPLQEDKIIADLADRWEVSPDGKEFTFYLRKNVKFHDGSDFAAADAKATFDRVIKPRAELALTRLAFWKTLDKAEVIDPYTFKLTLKRSQPSFLSLLAIGFSGMLSKKDLEANNGDLGDKQNGTGPFMFVDYTVGVSFEVKKNPNYYKEDRPYLDGVKQFILPDDNARLAAIRTKQIDLLFSFPGITAAQGKTLEQANIGVRIDRVETLVGLDYLAFNGKHKPYDNKLVRQAMNIVVDRPGFIDVARQGNGKLASLFPPSSPWGLPIDEVMKLPGWNPDKAKDITLAKELLAKAGYPNGFDGGTLLIRAGQTDEDAASYLQQEFLKIGIKLQQKRVDSTVFGQLTRAEDFDVYPIAEGNTVDDPDNILYGQYHGTNLPSWGVKDSKTDELIDKQSEMLNQEERKKLVWEIQRYIMTEHLNKIPIDYPTRLAPAWPYVKNWINHKSVYNNTKFQDIWLDK